MSYIYKLRGVNKKILSLILVVTIGIGGCTLPYKKAWLKAEKTNTVAGYKEYIRLYPYNKNRVQKAKLKIEEITSKKYKKYKLILSRSKLNISNVEVTKEEQNFFYGFDADMRSIHQKAYPQDGYSFVIVRFNISNPLISKIKIDLSDIILTDSSGLTVNTDYSQDVFSSLSGSKDIIWGSHSTVSFNPSNKKVFIKKLFIVKDDSIKNSKIIFNKKEYPLQ